MITYPDATAHEINAVMEAAYAAFGIYRKCSLDQRAALMHSIADALENSGDDLLQVAMAETHLPEARLRGERARTIFQWRSYADGCRQGDWLDARIDTADTGKTPPKPDLRKMLVPLGPVVVFGASNFPFAYSTAGGDTATALAAGCPVVVKAHPAHAQTSEMVANLVRKCVEDAGLPAGLFGHVHGASFEVGEALVGNPRTRAVGFTGSFSGGKALYDIAQQRKIPIPVFAEMGSINPIFLLPGRLRENPETLAATCAASITLGVGQFCTNPGLMVGIAGADLNQFTEGLKQHIAKVTPAQMLHGGIARAYLEKRTAALAQKGVSLVAVADAEAAEGQGLATIALVSGAVFLENPNLQHEVFGPFSLLVQCAHAGEMLAVARQLEGQLTCTVQANTQDLQDNLPLLEALEEKCGRLVFNGVPTGVEVCLSMHHGGPFPAATDSRFTSVGVDAIRRFARPFCWQNWPDQGLPMELRNANPLGISRIINNVRTVDAVSS